MVCVVFVWCVCVVCLCGVCVVWCVCGVCGSDDSRHGESVLARADNAPN